MPSWCYITLEPWQLFLGLGAPDSNWVSLTPLELGKKERMSSMKLNQNMQIWRLWASHELSVICGLGDKEDHPHKDKQN